MTAVDHTRDALKSWLCDTVLPLQQAQVRDLVNGGFHERMAPDGSPVDLPRRARVSARQLYSFSRLQALGVGSDTAALARAALDYLVGNHIRADGHVISEVAADGAVLNDRFDTYDCAFALFGLAATPATLLPRAEAMQIAGRITGHMTGWKHPDAGYEEAQPRQLPLRANPHMHLLEASLEWAKTDPNHAFFTQLADEIAELCLARFIDPGTGMVRELLDGGWQVLDDPDNLVEPGHQFEWGWLMLRWGRLRDRADATAAGIRMIDTAEARGINADGLAVSTLTPALDMADATARLWPQTERIKAWAIRAQHGPRADRDANLARVEAACAGLMRFFDHPVPGSWWENLDPGGRPLSEPARTSSLYHIVCAYCELDALCAPHG